MENIFTGPSADINNPRSEYNFRKLEKENAELKKDAQAISFENNTLKVELSRALDKVSRRNMQIKDQKTELEHAYKTIEKLRAEILDYKNGLIIR